MNVNYKEEGTEIIHLLLYSQRAPKIRVETSQSQKLGAAPSGTTLWVAGAQTSSIAFSRSLAGSSIRNGAARHEPVPKWDAGVAIYDLSTLPKCINYIRRSFVLFRERLCIYTHIHTYMHTYLLTPATGLSSL